MSQLKAGFARVNITPMMGIRMRGYFSERLADGVLDDLELTALALEEGGKRAILLNLDNCGILRECALEFKAHITEKTGIPADAVYIGATHTHTGPFLRIEDSDDLEKEYFQFLRRRMADVTKFALDDLKEAKVGYGVGMAPEIGFIRRFLMKDGTVKTNPQRNDPEIVRPMGEPDRRVHVLRFDREGGDHIVLVNYGNHPDVIGGCKISADWPGHLRREVEKNMDNVKCIFFNGCQGNVNHVDRFPKRTEKDFMEGSGMYGGYDHSKYMARALAGTVAQVYDKAQAMEDTELRYMQKTIAVPSNKPDPKDLPEAHRIHALWKEGKAGGNVLNSSKGSMGVAEANRMVALENAPDAFEMDMSAVAIGKVILVGIPGEPFAGIGFALKETPGWDMILATGLTNGHHGYLPMQSDYDFGGYEVISSRFKPGVAERIIAAGRELMEALKK